ncbi:MAG: (2Fe-2S)-binding protein [Dehalococcoidales bacterium]|nr:(2Fe-2S)-binding protein [Dehalococcoidales bacterium]
MSEQEETKQISRRQFLKNAGIVVGGTAVGSSFILAACKGDAEEVTKTVTVTTATAKFKCPYDGQEFDTYAELQAHVEAAHKEGDPITFTKFVSPYDGAEFDSLEALKAHLDANFMTAGIPGVVSFVVNGNPVTLKVEDYWTLDFVLRDRLALYGTKVGCGVGQCGACTVLVDGVPTFACLTLGIECGGKNIETIEGLSNGTNLSPLQQKMLDNEAFQCGFCTPGFIMAAKALLAENPNPTVDEVREAVAGHICTCHNFKATIATIAGGV